MSQAVSSSLLPQQKTSRVDAEKLAEINSSRDTPRGFSLEAPFYTDPDMFQLDMEAIFGQQWFCRQHRRNSEPAIT